MQFKDMLHLRSFRSEGRQVLPFVFKTDFFVFAEHSALISTQNERNFRAFITELCCTRHKIKKSIKQWPAGGGERVQLRPEMHEHVKSIKERLEGRHDRLY